MQSFAVDSENNFVFTNGNLVVITDGAVVLQRVKHALSSFQGDWFLDEDLGVDWFGDIMTKPSDAGKIESILKSVILSVDGVKSIITFTVSSFNSTTRRLIINFTADTDYGYIDSSQVYINIRG